MAAQLPVGYQAPSPDVNRYKINKVAIGYGKRSDFTELEKKKELKSPGPIYNQHLRNSISYKSEHLRKSQVSFFNKYDKYEKIIYKGMEKANYLKESPGVGTYMGQDIVTHSRIGESAKYNFAKKDRGLQGRGK